VRLANANRGPTEQPHRTKPIQQVRAVVTLIVKFPSRFYSSPARHGLLESTRRKSS
jgi:hypothetical protein